MFRKKKKYITVLVGSILSLAALCSAEQAAVETEGAVSSIIVYRGRALVTRTIEVDLSQGASQIVVQKLPETIVPASLDARAVGDVAISSVRYRQKDLKKEKGDEIKQLEEQIRGVEKQLHHTNSDHAHTGQLWNMYKDLWKLTLDGANADLNRSLLQPESIEKLTALLERKAIELHKENVEREDLRGELERQLGELNKQKQEAEAALSSTSREAVIFVNSESASRKTIELSYLVTQASWNPQYNLRAIPAGGKVAVEYNALIHQASGEDWDSVRLSLSTAAPATEAAPPLLEPMQIRLGTIWKRLYEGAKDRVEQVAAPRADVEQSYVDLSSEFKQVQESRRQAVLKGKAAQRELNVAAVSNQMMELQADKSGAELLKKETRRLARTEGISVTYSLGDGFSIPSRTGQELVNIASFESKAEFIMIASPILTDYVYLQAEITNDSDTILLAGPASMYADGQFVGKSDLESVTIGEKFTAGFGVDSQVQISREFKDKKVDTLWGNRVEKYEYRIAIENYKKTGVKLQLVERIPYTEDEGIEITGFETNVPLSSDADYIRTQKDKGILRWDLNLSANTTGQKTKIITYGYTMKYDKDKSIEPVNIKR
jgi:hypothetical protein